MTNTPSDCSDRSKARCARPNGDKIGHIERLMIDKVTGKVSYAILSFGGFLAWEPACCRCHGASYLQHQVRGYQLDIDDDELKRAPSFRADKDFDWAIARRKQSCIAITERRPIGGLLTASR